MNKLTALRATILLAIMTVMLAACGILQNRDSEARLVTMYATIKVVNGDPARADKVITIASNVREYSSGQKQLTINALITQIRKEVPFSSLDAADTLLVNTLIDELQFRLEERFGKDILPESLQLAVDVVADWVITAAQMT